MVPAAQTVLVDGIDDVAALEVLLLDAGTRGSPTSHGELVEIPVTYDGPDLADVATRWGTTPEDVVARHTAIEFVSRFCGFAPGLRLSGRTARGPRGAAA